jgi:hypothetical protein
MIYKVVSSPPAHDCQSGIGELHNDDVIEKIIRKNYDKMHPPPWYGVPNPKLQYLGISWILHYRLMHAMVQPALETE